MKNLRILPFLVVSTLLLLTSCTFQKRVHNRGFHIDWKSTKSTSANQSIAKNQQLKKADKEVVKLDSVQTETNLILPEPTPQVSAGADLAEPIILPKVKENYFKKEFNAQKEQLKKMAKPLNKKQENDLNVLSIISLIQGIMSILSVILLLFTDFELLILSSIIFATLAIILGTIALKQIKDNPGNRMGKSYALGGILAGSFTILFWLFLFFLLLLFFFAYF